MLLIFSDLHLDAFRRFSTITAGGINSRLQSQIDTINKVKKIADRLQPEAIMFLGDFWNGQGATISKHLYLIGHRLVSSLQKIAPLYLVVGNHDIYGSINILEPMNDLPNVTVVSETLTIKWQDYTVGLQPWRGICPSSDICLGHIDFEGTPTGLGYDLPGTTQPQEYKEFKLVISGHFHKYQKIDPNIIYCGSVMPITFGDVADDNYGCLLLNSNLSTQRVIIDSPKFIPVTINNQADLDKFMENKSKNYYRLSITDRKVNVPKFDHTIEIGWDIQEEIQSRLSYEADKPLEDVLCQYIDQTDTKANKEEAKKIIREIMEEA